MKTYKMLLVMVFGWITSFGQAIEPEVPGDHFSLEGALELFKKSSSPEQFEKMLNSPDSKVNNLDLNGDGYVDYIRVHDRYEGNVHAFIIQAVISERELQDVAVIELEKLGNGKAVLQIVGDEDIYGVTTIIEPTEEVRTYAGARNTRTVVNVWAWPSVQYVYGPYYTTWVSPWGWHHHPLWWHTWRPVAYVHYYPLWRPYHHHYVYCDTRRIARAHYIYRPHRATSVVVYHRHRDKVTRYRSAHRDNHRNGRTREEVRRSYAREDRSSTHNTDSYQRSRREADVPRRSPVQRETQTSRERTATPERSASRQRTPSAQRNLTSNERSLEMSAPRPAAPVRERQSTNVNPPAVSRPRATQAPVAQQRQAARERSAPAVYNRTSPSMTKGNSSSRRLETSTNDRAMRQETVRPSRSTSTPRAMPQRSTESSGRTRGRQ